MLRLQKWFFRPVLSWVGPFEYRIGSDSTATLHFQLLSRQPIFPHRRVLKSKCYKFSELEFMYLNSGTVAFEQRFCSQVSEATGVWGCDGGQHAVSWAGWGHWSRDNGAKAWKQIGIFQGNRLRKYILGGWNGVCDDMGHKPVLSSLHARCAWSVLVGKQTMSSGTKSVRVSSRLLNRRLKTAFTLLAGQLQWLFFLLR